MNETPEQLIAACGLDCEACDIRRVPFDMRAARNVVAWFRQRGWLEPNEGVDDILRRGMYCKGCKGDRSLHWSPDCWILRCCVDDKGLEFCSRCDDFPCERLVEWGASDPGYGQALDRLKQMKALGR